MTAAIKKTEVITVESQPLAPVQSTAMELIRAGATPEQIEKYMILQERWDANQARKAFDEAMAAAQAEMPAIIKDKEVDFTSQKGRTNYKHASLSGIEKAVKPVLAKHGLHYRHNTAVEPGASVTVTCVIAHRDGHSENNALSAPLDVSGNKNPIQQIGSTVTYLQRYTLMAALGLGASEDDDGHAAGVGSELLTPEQMAQLNAKIKEIGIEPDKVRAFAKVETFAEIYSKDFEKLLRALDTWAAKQQGKSKS